jgi:hypothetical protein
LIKVSRRVYSRDYVPEEVFTADWLFTQYPYVEPVNDDLLQEESEEEDFLLEEMSLEELSLEEISLGMVSSKPMSPQMESSSFTELKQEQIE